MPVSLGPKLRHLRRQRELTQAALAQEIGLSRSHLTNLELGRESPSIIVLVKLASFFQISLDYLLRDSRPVDVMMPHTFPPPPDAQGLLSSFGAKVEQLRLRNGLTQSALAEQLDLSSQAYISLLEAGHREPALEVVLKMMELFKVSADELLFGLPVS